MSNEDIFIEVSGKPVATMTQEVVDWCKSKGWYDKESSFLEHMALLHSEVSEAVEVWRLWGLEDATDLRSEQDELDGAWPKPEGVGSELADVFIRLLDDCGRYGIDLEAEYERKMRYNRTRAYRHGGKKI